MLGPIKKIILFLLYFATGLTRKLTSQQKFFALGWRFIFGMMILVYLATGWQPLDIIKKKIQAFKGGTAMVRIYPGLVEGESEDYFSGWHNLENIKAPPDLSPKTKADEFNLFNSALYNGGKESIVLSNFSLEFLADEISESGSLAESKLINDEEVVIDYASSTDLASSTDEEVVDDSMELNNATSSPFITSTSSPLEQITNSTTQYKDTKASSTEIIELEIDSITQGEVEIVDTIASNSIEVIQVEEEDIEIIIEEGGETSTTSSGLISKRNKWLNPLVARAQTGQEADKYPGDFRGANIGLSIAFLEAKIIISPPEEASSTDEEIAIASSTYIDLGSTSDDVIQDEESTTSSLEIIIEEADTSTEVEVVELEELASTTISLRGFFNIKTAQAQAGPKLVIWYSLIKENSTSTEEVRLWQKATELNQDIMDNLSNDGYLEIPADFIHSWEDIERLAIKIEGVVSHDELFVVYLDSLWVEAVYESEEQLENKYSERWQDALEFLSDSTVLIAGEKGELRFRYTKNEERIWDTLKELIGWGNFWQDVEITATLTDSRGARVDFPLTMIFGDDGEFIITLPDDERALTPGKYTIQFQIIDNSGEETEFFSINKSFEWGVLAMNFNKSVYREEEVAYIQMAVLDELGHTRCNADLHLEITTPEGYRYDLSTKEGSIIKNPRCGPETVIEEPDYYAYHHLGEAGEYQIVLTAYTVSGDKTIEETILVNNERDFMVERIGPTRIYPKVDYSMQILISSEDDFIGEINELVPNGFKITNYQLRITNSDEHDPFGSDYGYSEEIIGNEKVLTWQDIELVAGDELEIVYTFDAPDKSPELYLLGPLAIGEYEEKRKWQIASDAVAKRARTAMFLAGTYNGSTGSGQNTNTNNTFSTFQFQLAETGVDIESAFIVFESQFEAYADNVGDYTGYTLTFDACEEVCTADAFDLGNNASNTDSTVLAYDEGESNQARLLLDISNEPQLAAYTGSGIQMEGQVGYNLAFGSTQNTIASAKAVLYLTYSYDASSENITNTVVYPLESTDTAPAPDDSGSRQGNTPSDCTLGTDCAVFSYDMDLPEFPGYATSTYRLSQWFKLHETNDSNGGRDIDTNVRINSGTTKTAFHHESALAGTQGNVAAIYVDSVSGYSENLTQTIEYQPVTGNAGDDHYIVGGEIFETYVASSSAATSTRTVSFPLGVIKNGQSTTAGYREANIYFPENGTATGTVEIKKIWVRLIGSNAISSAINISAATKVGNNATSSTYTYVHNPGGNPVMPVFRIFQVIDSSNYSALEEANAVTGVRVGVEANDSVANSGAISAELMITYTYTSEAVGYLTNLKLFAGQINDTATSSSASTVVYSVAPEKGNKTIYGGEILSHFLMSDSAASVGSGIVYQMDADITTGTADCSGAARGVGDSNSGQNTFWELITNVSSGLTTQDNQALNVCYKSDEPLVGTDAAKKGGVLTYTYGWENSAPTSSIQSAVHKGDGSGVVDITIEAGDADGHDVRARLDYEAGVTCTFGTPLDPELDETDGNITADYGDPNIENDNTYQIGTIDSYIQTGTGSNQVHFDWLSKTDIDDVEGDYCLRLIANDQLLDQTPVATTTVYIDNIDPTAPGALNFESRTGTTTTFAFGATSTETNFYEYKIFYKVKDGTDPTESDSLWASTSDADLGDQLFNGTGSTTITGLIASTTYSFAIWTYDSYGNRASSSRVDITTNDAPTGEFKPSSQKTDGSGVVDIEIEVDDANNQDTCKAKIEYVKGGACDFSSPNNPTLDENPASILADFGLPIIDNDQTYQVGSSSTWILTSPGSNSVQFDWLSQTDLPYASSTYCLRLTVNDRFDDQLIATTTTLTVDNFNPTATGDLTAGKVTTDFITLIYATNTPATDTSEPVSNAYRIYYKQGTSGVDEGDTEHDDAVMDAYDYGGTATSTAVSGLDSNTWYVFNIWAYDAYGNKATSSEIAIKTNATLSNDSLTFTNPFSKGGDNNIAIAGTSTEWNIRAVVSETNGWYAIGSTTLRLADKSDDSSPFNDLMFKWNQTTDTFSETGSDVLSAVTLSSNSTSSCAGNTCTLNFKLLINKTFASSSWDYIAELFSDNDSSVTDFDSYPDFYQVRYPYVAQFHYRWRNDDGGE